MPRQEIRQITPRQLDVLRQIASFEARQCCSATIGELAQELSVSRPTAFEHVGALRKKGLVKKSQGKARSLKLTPRANRLLDLDRQITAKAQSDAADQITAAGPAAAVDSAIAASPVAMTGPVTTASAATEPAATNPAVAATNPPAVPLVGRVAAGQPIEAIENRQDLSLGTMFGRPDDLFALEVAGDSMIDEGIFTGDFVICQKTASAENGQLVVAIVEDENATLKRFYKQPDCIKLESANQAYEPIYTNHCRIEAVVLGLLRRL